MWGFEEQGAIPDITVMGKPMGNGFPLATVAFTNETASAFEISPEFFSTFGGSSVACAAGNAVLGVREKQKLQAKAAKTGDRLLGGLKELQFNHQIIGT